jgi:hypothetical protein
VSKCRVWPDEDWAISNWHYTVYEEQGRRGLLLLQHDAEPRADQGQAHCGFSSHRIDAVLHHILLRICLSNMTQLARLGRHKTALGRRESPSPATSPSVARGRQVAPSATLGTQLAFAGHSKSSTGRTTQQHRVMRGRSASTSRMSFGIHPLGQYCAAVPASTSRSDPAVCTAVSVSTL